MIMSKKLIGHVPEGTLFNIGNTYPNDEIFAFYELLCQWYI